MTYRCHLFYCIIMGKRSAKMKKEVLVFIFDGYADWESSYICSELNSPETDYIVKALSLDKDPKISMGGFRIISFVGSIDSEEFPNVKAMLPPRKREGIKYIYFTTNTSSMRVSQYKENSKAGVYFFDKRFFRGVMLKGTMEVLEDSNSKEIH